MSAAALPRDSQADPSFGRRLRRERERRKIALASIAENSKISASLLEALERDDVSRWPSGIFRKSFIRAYAQAIGLDPDETTREFLERFPDPHDPGLAPLSPTATPPAPSAPVAPASTTGPGRPTLKVSVMPTTGRTFARGRVLTGFSNRAMAIAWDAGIVITLGLLLYAAVGSLWGPLCLAMTIYYAIGVLVFGNTPGVCLCAPSLGEAGSAPHSSLASVLREAAAVIRPRRSSPSSSGESNNSTDSDPSPQSDGSTVHPYQAREI